MTPAIANANGQIVGATWISASSSGWPSASRAPASRKMTPRKQKVTADTSSSVVPACSWLVSP